MRCKVGGAHLLGESFPVHDPDLEEEATDECVHARQRGHPWPEPITIASSRRFAIIGTSFIVGASHSRLPTASARQTRSTSATLQAWAMHPLGR